MIGIDTVNIERLRSTLGRSPGLEARLFSQHELSYCRAKADPVMHLAGTLAAKEAVIKARGLGPLVAWSRRIEIRRAENGAPVATIKGADHDPIHLSISHDGPVAVAVALTPVSLKVKESADSSPRAVARSRGTGYKPNERLRRYIGVGEIGSVPKDAAVLARASDLVGGTDFP